ncbi:hypothetical protein PVAG01_07579 [Phlyctema vagabunda]|uniref:Uncharacterized protein n=1 Tax=Phlyctema vagabunda TaxID=108571 RepID=A0ABR4PCT6_9HELO
MELASNNDACTFLLSHCSHLITLLNRYCKHQDTIIKLCQHQSIPAMNTNSSNSSPVVGALVLIPIIIAASAAFIALKTTELGKKLIKFCSKNLSLPNFSRKARQQSRSNQSSETYADSWYDLESVRSGQAAIANPLRIMAPAQVSAACMELFESTPASSISKPPPLRIIKRSQTISGLSSPREVFGRNTRGLSESSYESKGSPPMGPDRPLTIHKVRRGVKGSVLEGLEDGSFKAQSDETIKHLVQRHNSKCNDDDTDVTPKACQESRITGVPASPPKEVQQTSADGNDPRAIKDSLASDDSISPFRHAEGQLDISSPPKIPKRRLSKSKNFFRKAIGGRSTVPEKPGREASDSFQIPRRRLSRKKMRSSSQVESEVSILVPNVPELESQDITEVCIDPRMTEYGHRSVSNTSARSLISESFILCPRITFTTETMSTDSAICSVWVAISISGVLINARGEVEQRSANRIERLNQSELRAHGQLYDVDMRLEPGPDCVIEEIFPSDDVSSICAGETSLFLVKVRLWKVKTSERVKESSDELFAELETHLAGTVTQYLTVRLAYRHSGHLFRRDDGNGIPLINTTRIHTESIATIKRADLKSAWSPRSSRKVDAPFGGNPLYTLIERHFAHDTAREAMRRLSEERVYIPRARHPGEEAQRICERHASDQASEETARAYEIAAQIDSAVSVLMKEAQQDRSPSAASIKALEIIDSAAEAEGDRARQIWLSMRGDSRSRTTLSRSGTRRSITDEDFFDARSVSASTSASFATVDDGRSDRHENEDEDQGMDMRGEIERERGRIKELALRNKRSVGTETLRSMAPSHFMGASNAGYGTGRMGSYGYGRGYGYGISSSLGFATGSPVKRERADGNRNANRNGNGNGNGIGRSWGWGPPWW